MRTAGLLRHWRVARTLLSSRHETAIRTRSGIAIGVAIGIAMGTALHNIGLGIALGAAFGAAFEGASRRRDRNRQEKGDAIKPDE